MIAKKHIGNARQAGAVVNSILEAAAFILAKVGYGGSTTNHIAEKAGVSIGSLYYHFSGKDAVYQKLTDEVMSEYLARLDQHLATVADRDKLHALLIKEVVAFTFEKRPLLRKLFALSPQLERMETVYNLRNEFAAKLGNRLPVSEAPAPLDMFILVNAVNGVLDNFIYSSNCPATRETMEAALLALTRGAGAR